MKYEDIQVWDKIELAPKKKHTPKSVGDNQQNYVSQVVSLYREEKVFVMFSPIVHGEIYVPEDNIFELIFYTKNERMKCDGMVLRSYKQNDFYLSTVRIISPFEKAQMRKFIRYQCVIPLKYTLLSEDDNFMEVPKNTHDGITKDLSGGGVMFTGDHKLEVNTRLRIVIEKSDGSLIADGLVVFQKVFIDENENIRYETSVKFVSVSDSRRKALRYACSLPFTYAILKPGEKYDPYTIIPSAIALEGELKDIGEGGIRFQGKTGHRLYSKLKIVIQQNEVPLLAEGQVVDHYILELNDDEALYETCVKFISVTYNNRKSRRYSCELPLRYTIADLEATVKTKTFYHGKIIDISEGGIRFCGDIPLKADVQITMELEKQEGIMLIEGRIVNQCNATKKHAPYLYETSVQFTTIFSTT